MSEPVPDLDPDRPTGEQLAEIAGLRRKIEVQLEALDALLGLGSSLNAVLEQHYEETGFTPGVGRRVLLGNTVPPEDRKLFSLLLTEYENLEDTIRNFDKRVAATTSMSAASRAVGNRYRI